MDTVWDLFGYADPNDPDAGLDWQWVERESKARSMCLERFLHGVAILRREDGIFAAVDMGCMVEWTTVVIGADPALLLEHTIVDGVRIEFPTRVARPGYGKIEFRAFRPTVRFTDALDWIRAWRPDPLGALVQDGHVAGRKGE